LRTGSLPFEDESCAAVLTAHLRGDIDFGRLPEREREVLRRATALDPTARFRTARELVSMLRMAVQSANPNQGAEGGRIGTGCHLGANRPLEKDARSRWFPWFAGIACVAALVIVGTAATVLTTDNHARPRGATSVPDVAPARLTDKAVATSAIASVPANPKRPDRADRLAAGAGDADLTTPENPFEKTIYPPGPAPSVAGSLTSNGDNDSVAPTGSPRTSGQQVTVPSDEMNATNFADAHRDQTATNVVLTPLRIVGGHSLWPTSVAFSPSGDTLLSGSWDETARLWEVRTGVERTRFQGHEGTVADAAFLPPGRSVITAGHDGTLRLWDANTSRLLEKRIAHKDAARAVTVSPDGKHLASAGADRLIRIWSVDTGHALYDLRGHTEAVTAIAFSPDNRRIASGSEDTTVRIWDLDKGQQVKVLTGHILFVTRVAYSPSGHHLASASWDHTARIWDAETGEPLHCLSGHANVVSSVAFSPDGRLLITASHDKTVRVWDCNSGREITTADSDGGEVYSVAVSPDGTHIVTANEDRTLTLWELRSGQTR